MLENTGSSRLRSSAIAADQRAGQDAEAAGDQHRERDLVERDRQLGGIFVPVLDQHRDGLRQRRQEQLGNDLRARHQLPEHEQRREDQPADRGRGRAAHHEVSPVIPGRLPKPAGRRRTSPESRITDRARVRADRGHGFRTACSRTFGPPYASGMTSRRDPITPPCGSAARCGRAAGRTRRSPSSRRCAGAAA